jgi:type IV pilus assembly protein PilC
MATYKYTVRDKSGKTVDGTLEGESKEAVSARLRQMGYVIVGLEESGGLIASMSQVKFGTGVKPKDVTIFARQFSTMINAGLSLTKCLSILGQQTESEGLRTVITQIGKDALGLDEQAPQGLPADLHQHGPCR